jgi:hypothetical protein
MWLEPAVERRAEQVNGQQRSAQVTFEHGAGAGQLFGDFAWADRFMAGQLPCCSFK